MLSCVMGFITRIRKGAGNLMMIPGFLGLPDFSADWSQVPGGSVVSSAWGACPSFLLHPCKVTRLFSGSAFLCSLAYPTASWLAYLQPCFFSVSKLLLSGAFASA